MSPPIRIQRKRTKGWRMPEGAVYVGRPSRWGNPHRVGAYVGCDCLQEQEPDEIFTAERAIEAFRVYSGRYGESGPGRWAYYDLATLRGKDLACWCALDQPCHADVLLELANATG